MKTHYDVLGVPFDADYETIKAAYRRALKKHHPDLADGSGADDLQSKQIIDAHAVLRDPGQRARYDQTLKHRRQQRRRLFLIITLLTAGVVCVGTLVAVALLFNGR
jgi:DnaJ-class molecular chaperone